MDLSSKSPLYDISVEGDGSVFGAVADFLNAARLPPALSKLDGDFRHLLKKENVMLLRDRARQWEAQLAEREKKMAQQFQKGAEEGLRRGKEVGREEGLRRGKEEGLRRGKDIGRREALRDTLLNILEARFQGGSPERLEKVIALEDEAKLKALTTSAATVPTLASFYDLLESL